MASALIARALSRTYERARPALSPVDFDLPRGAVLLVLGPSGAGKSTLLNLIGGLDRPTSGSLAVLGREIARLSETALAAYRRTTVTTLFQHHLLPTGLRAEEAVAAPLLWGRGMAPGEAIRRARELLVRFGLSPAEVRRPVQRLSGGQRQRVAFARALAPEPPLLLADEPTSQLDPRNAGLLFTALRDYHDAGGTLVVAAHRPPEAWPFPDAIRLELEPAPAGA